MKKILSVTLVIILTILSGGGGFLAGRYFEQKQKTKLDNRLSEKNLSQIEENKKSKEDIDWGVIYLSDGSDSCKYCQAAPIYGYLKAYEGREMIFPFQDTPSNEEIFSWLKSPVPVKLESKAIYLTDLHKDRQDNVYITAEVQGKQDINDYETVLAEVDENTGEARTIWKTKESDNEYQKGAFLEILSSLTDEHLLLNLYSPGDARQPKNLLIINTKTGARKFLGPVSFRQDFPNLNFSYKKLEAVKVPCSDEISCDRNGEMIEYFPSGQYIFDTLP